MASGIFIFSCFWIASQCINTTMVNKATGKLVMSNMSAWGLSLTIMAQLIKSEHGKVHFIKLSHFGHLTKMFQFCGIFRSGLEGVLSYRGPF